MNQRRVWRSVLRMWPNQSGLPKLLKPGRQDGPARPTWIIDVESREVRQLTQSPWRISGYVWMPNGERLVMSATDHPQPELETNRIFELRVSNREMTRFPAPRTHSDNCASLRTEILWLTSGWMVTVPARGSVRDVPGHWCNADLSGRPSTASSSRSAGSETLRFLPGVRRLFERLLPAIREPNQAQPAGDLQIAENSRRCSPLKISGFDSAERNRPRPRRCLNHGNISPSPVEGALCGQHEPAGSGLRGLSDRCHSPWPAD